MHTRIRAMNIRANRKLTGIFKLPHLHALQLFRPIGWPGRYRREVVNQPRDVPFPMHPLVEHLVVDGGIRPAA